MPPKKKAAKTEKDDGEEGGALSLEEQIAMYQTQSKALQLQLAERHEECARALSAKKEMQQRLKELEDDFEKEKQATLLITKDMTRQYKSMQEQLLDRVTSLENSITELKDQLEISKKSLEDTKVEKDRIISLKEKEIAACKKKMDEMAREFSSMLQDTLDRMCEKIEVTNKSFEKETGVPIVTRLEEININSK